MGEVLFTTNDVASILRVDKSTVKRWTDEGKLKCFRTPGGHRKFRSDDLYSFMTENNYDEQTMRSVPQVMSDEMIIRSIVQQREYNMLHSVCFSSAIKGNRDELMTLFRETFAAGMTLSAVFDHILRPTSKKLNDLVRQNKLSVSEFHLAQNVLSSVFIALNPTLTHQPRNRKTVVCAAVENGMNEVELTAMATMLDVNGYTVLNLGTGLSGEAINQFVTRTKPYAVMLYAAVCEQRDHLIAQLRSVSEFSRRNGSYCFVCGTGVTTAEVKGIDDVRLLPTFGEVEQMESLKNLAMISK